MARPVGESGLVVRQAGHTRPGLVVRCAQSSGGAIDRTSTDTTVY